MVVRTALLLALLAAATMSGCLDDSSDGTGSGASLDAIPTGTAPSGEGAGSAGTHGNPSRDDSAVTVRRQGDEYVAAKTVTFANDFAGAAQADVKLTTRVGGVTAEDWGNGGYEVVATLQGRGVTEQAARDNLARLQVVHSDRLGAGRLSLETTVQFPAIATGLSGSLVAHLPASPAYRITGTTGTGGASVSGLGGPTVTLSTDTGGVSAEGAFNTATLQTDTGGVLLDGVFNVVRGSTSTGGVEARIRSTASGSIELSCDTGGIDLALDGDAGTGYDVEADVATGGISIELGPVENVGSQSRTHKHVRTAGYDDADLRVTVDVETDTGGIDVRG